MTDGTTGGRGITYETRLCMLLACRGYIRGLEHFRLRYQVPESEAGKFDDIVFDVGGRNYQVFQLKHKENAQIRISNSQLFHETFNADYNLLKYVKSVIDINSNNCLGGEMRMAVVFTNIDFDFQKDSNQLSLISNRKDWYKEFTDIQLDSFEPDENALFSFPDAKYYKFDKDPNIVQILKRQSETVSKELRKKLERQKNTKTGKYENQHNQLKENDEAVAKFFKNLTEEDIREALKYIVYAVRQPNDKELETQIKNEIKGYFKLQDADAVYALFENAMIKWCNTKDPFDDQSSSSNPHIIQFKDTETIFEKNVKNMSFGFFSPTSSFTGRTDELNRIRVKLEENPNLIISQSVKISGLGGIGKTELAKQFIKKFGQSDFYGRVIWIEAESDESVEKSFKLLAEKVNIQDRANKSTTTIIDDIFDYFNGVKVLFVFDNFDKNIDDAATYAVDKEKHFVIYCQKKACDPTKKHRPYFIFTSRNRECLPGVSSLDLGVLTKEDTNELIKKGLIIKNVINHDVDDLAKTLQYFPLALKQAIAYINRQHEIRSVLGGRYIIEDYLIEFVEKTKKLLNYPHTNDFGEFKRTTWITWNVTFDAITKDKINGPNAIKVLQFMSYLYADEIDAKMFLSQFKSDLGEAFLLLQKYSIIQKKGGSTFYQIHRLVQAVVQLNFMEERRKTLQEAWKLIFPELFESYSDKNKFWLRISDKINLHTESDWHRLSELMDQCTVDQILHYNSLATYIKSYTVLSFKFQTFLDDINEWVLWVATMNDDIDKIKNLQLHPEALKKFAKRNIRLDMKKTPSTNGGIDARVDELNSKNNIYSAKVVKYFIDNEYLKVTDSMLLDAKNDNLDMFKSKVEKAADLKVLKLVAPDLIRDVIQGKSDLLLDCIKSKETKENCLILKESLFFASLFNQESIVELLINNNVELDYKFRVSHEENTAIKAVVKLNYPHILKIILKAFNKREHKDKLAQIINEPAYELDENLNCFEIAVKKYFDLGGDINDKHKFIKNSTFLTRATHMDNKTIDNMIITKKRWKIDIINFLLDNGANPCLLNDSGNSAFFNILFNIKDPYNKDTYDKGHLNDIYNKMRLKISTEQFISSIFEHLKILFHRPEYLKEHNDLLQNINDINFRNDKGETLLITIMRLFNVYNMTPTIILLLEASVDVNAKDNDGRDALYYALDKKPPEIFTCLLTKVNSVSDKILMKAIKEDKSHCVDQILKTHAKVNHTFKDGKTLVEVAFENLSLDTILLLHPKIKELKLETGECEKICKMAQMALIQYIKSLMSPFKRVNINYLEAFIEIASDINAIDEDGNNALHYAAFLYAAKETFMYLLSKGSKVLEKTLEHAIKNDQLYIVKAIIPKYFKKDHLFTNGMTTIELATSNEFKTRIKNFLTE